MTDKRRMELIKRFAFKCANIKYMHPHKLNCEDIIFINALKSKLKHYLKGEMEGISNEEKN